MGLFHVGCKVENHRTGKSVVISRLMVDTGSELTWIDAHTLEELGIERRKKDIQIQMANGQVITRSVGYAVIRVERAETIDEVVFAEPGDLTLLGCRALEGLHLKVDSRQKKLVASGPVIAATAIKLSRPVLESGALCLR
jgi:predicted aspartyl protease